MNKTFRSIWNERKQAYVAAAETVAAGGKRSSSAVALAAPALALLALSGAASAADLPTGGSVVAGGGTISTTGSQMTINQSTNKLAIDWQSFNIGKGNTVEFVQPSSSAVALNRVLGTDVSVIQGALKANGQVFLINPNGVLFTSTAQVNVGGIVASTLNIKTDDFLAGNYRFEGASSNAIVNQGNITTAAGGSVALIAAKITSTGQINAERGHVLMGAGSKVKMDLGGPVKVEVEQGAIDALIEQGGGIRADGGLVYLTAKAVGELTTTVINHTGITEARTMATGEKGQIVLLGGMEKDRIVVGGKLDASAPSGGDGGFIETSAANVKVAQGAKVSAGHWLIDPTDITIDAAMASTIQGQLAGGDATVTTASGNSDAGDIVVNAGITWSSGKTLTLHADRNITINAALDASGGTGGKLALEYGQGAVAASNTATYTINAPVNLKDGENFSTTLGSDGTVVNYTVISSAAAVKAIGTNLSGNIALGSNVDLSSTAWTPIGVDFNNPFVGNFDGLGHTIDKLTLNEPTKDFMGLFGYTADFTKNASIRNIGLTNVDITGKTYTGALIGYAETGTTVHNAYAIGAVTGKANHVGGLVGQNNGLVNNSYATVSVTADGGNGTWGAGGLVGYNKGTISSSHATGSVTATDRMSEIGGLVGENGGTITNSYATGIVTGTDSSDWGSVGGLVGANLGPIKTSYATGHVNGYQSVGGLVGAVWDGFIENSYASGTVEGTFRYVGGLVGDMGSSTNPTITSSYATGAVTGTGTGTGTYSVGGLVGATWVGTIEKSYATGAVTSKGNRVGGLVGENGVNITDSYATGSVQGADQVGGLLGLNSDGSTARTYSIGVVTGSTGSTNIGGLVGKNDSSKGIQDSFWLSTSAIKGVGSETSPTPGVTAKTASEMQTRTTFSGWSFTESSVDGVYPTLTMTSSGPIWKMAPNTTTLTYTLTNVGADGSLLYKGTLTIVTDTTGAIASAQAQAAQAAQVGSGLPLRSDTGPSGRDSVRGNNATALAAAGGVANLAPANIVQSGGLLLQLSEESGANTPLDNDAEQRQRNNASQTASNTISAGRDASGFMNVFVVRGGLNTNFNPAGGR